MTGTSHSLPIVCRKVLTQQSGILRYLIFFKTQLSTMSRVFTMLWSLALLSTTVPGL